MITVISPAKRLDEAPRALPAGLEPTKPAFAPQARELATLARGLTPTDLRRLMGISQPLAELNAGRFAAFGKQSKAPAAMMFAGDTYAGLEPKTLDTPALEWAQNHLRILSGLYGLLRPLDLIEPYRLEMGSRLANPKGADLYAFWGARIAKALNTAAKEAGTDTLINCASVEYFGAVEAKSLRLRVITPVFIENREGGEAKIISFWAKKARGAMARYIAENRLTDPQAIKDFTTGGYRHAPDLSDGDRWVFLRDTA
jgi:uncharacterized protein